jgi:hypothetical protein
MQLTSKQRMVRVPVLTTKCWASTKHTWRACQLVRKSAGVDFNQVKEAAVECVLQRSHAESWSSLKGLRSNFQPVKKLAVRERNMENVTEYPIECDPS